MYEKKRKKRIKMKKFDCSYLKGIFFKFGMWLSLNEVDITELHMCEDRNFLLPVNMLTELRVPHFLSCMTLPCAFICRMWLFYFNLL